MKPMGVRAELEEACVSCSLSSAPDSPFSALLCEAELCKPCWLCQLHAIKQCQGGEPARVRKEEEQATLFIPLSAVATNITSELFLHHVASLLLPHGSNWNQFIVFITLAESVSLCPPPQNTSKNCLMPPVLRPGSQVHRAQVSQL